MVEQDQWAAVNTLSNKVEGVFICTDGGSLQIKDCTMQPYDPDIHPPVGYDVEVGADWLTRWKEKQVLVAQPAETEESSTSDSSVSEVEAPSVPTEITATGTPTDTPTDTPTESPAP